MKPKWWNKSRSYLIKKDKIEEKLTIFKKEIKKEVLLMSTLKKKTVSNVKSRLINYVS